MRRTEAGSCMLIIGQMVGVGILATIGMYVYEGSLNLLQGFNNVFAYILYLTLVLPKILLIFAISSPAWSIPICFLIILVFAYIGARKQGASVKPGFFITLIIVIGYLIYRFFAL